jgi:hypothetical protein
VPPPGSVFTNWPAGGLELYVPVLAVDTTETYQFVLMEDYGTPNSVPLSPNLNPPTAGAPCTQFNCFFGAPDAGGVEDVPVPLIPIPADSNCHTFTLFVGATPGSAFPTPKTPPSLSIEPSPLGGSIVFPFFGTMDQIQWTYDPSGGLGLCPLYDAGALTDGPDASMDVAGPDVVLGNFPDGNGG